MHVVYTSMDLWIKRSLEKIFHKMIINKYLKIKNYCRHVKAHRFPTSLLPLRTRQNWNEFSLVAVSDLMALYLAPTPFRLLLPPGQWNHTPQGHPWPPCCWIRRSLLRTHWPYEQYEHSWTFPPPLSRFQTFLSLALPPLSSQPPGWTLSLFSISRCCSAQGQSLNFFSSPYFLKNLNPGPWL